MRPTWPSLEALLVCSLATARMVTDRVGLQSTRLVTVSSTSVPQAAQWTAERCAQQPVCPGGRIHPGYSVPCCFLREVSQPPPGSTPPYRVPRALAPHHFLASEAWGPALGWGPSRAHCSWWCIAGCCAPTLGERPGTGPWGQLLPVPLAPFTWFWVCPVRGQAGGLKCPTTLTSKSVAVFPLH